jgi:hypothetical protein
MSFSCDIMKNVIHGQKVSVHVSHLLRQHYSRISMIISFSGEYCYENEKSILHLGIHFSKLCDLVSLIDPIVY